MLKVHSDAEQLEKYYTFRDKERVLAFIEQNPNLLGLLFTAPAQISRFFPSANLFLEVVQDVEIPAVVKLWIFIATEYRGEAGISKLELLDDTWWLEASKNNDNIEILLDA
jgi:hypothetical protein